MAAHKEAPEGAICIDEMTLRSFHPKAARLNLDGIELEGPRMILTFEVEVDRVLTEMNRLTRIFRKRNAVRLRLDFVEQMELPRLEEVNPRPRLSDPLGTMPVGKNGHGKTHVDDLANDRVDDTPPLHIGEAIKKTRSRAKSK